MPVGDVEALLYKNPVAKFLARTFGGKGLHDHLRIAPLVRYARRSLRNRKIRVLEIGCGEGWSLFELAKVQGANMTAEGYDFDQQDIDKGKMIASAAFPGISFHCADAFALTEIREKYDVVLLMDFLEHITDPQAIIAKLIPCLALGGLVIVSVPTPRYPVVFTRAMHERIGHVVDGYTEESLAGLFPPPFRLVQMSRNTGLPAQYGCWLQSRLPQLPYLLDWAKNIVITSVFRKLDWVQGKRSCSLFAVFERV